MTSGIGVKLTLEGEQAFKDGLKAASKEYSVLTSEMKAATSTMDMANRSVEDITKQNEILTKQIAATSDKIKILEEAYRTSAEQRGEDNAKTKEWLIQLNNAKATLGKLETQLEANNNELITLADGTQTTATAQRKLEEETAKAEAALKEQQKAAAEARATLSEYAKKGADVAVKSLEALAAASAAAVAAVSKLVLDAANAADELGDMSTKTGIAVEKLQEYDYAAEMLGTSLETITGAQAKLIKDMSSAAKGTGDMAEAFRALGVSVTDSNGQLRDSETVFNEVIDALGSIQNETERDAAAMKIFGKSAQELNPIIKAGSAGLAEYTQEARALGLIMSEEAVNSLTDFQSEVKRVRAQVKALGNTIAGEFTPVATELAKTIQGLLKETQAQLQSPKMKQSIQQLGKSVADFTAKAVELGIKVLPKVASAVSFVVDNFNLLAIALGSIFVLLKGFSTVNKVITTFQTLSTAIKTLHGASTAAAAAQTALSSAGAAAATANTALAGANTAAAASVTELAAAATAAHAAIFGVIGVVAAALAAVGAFVIGGINHAKKIRDTVTEDTEAISDAIAQTTAEMQDAVDSYRDSAAETETTSQTALAYIARLRELERQTSLTADETREYNELVGKLKAAMPDLNIEIDAQTGKLKTTTRVLEEQIKQWTAKIKLEQADAALQKAISAQIQQETNLKAIRDANAALLALGEHYEQVKARWQNGLFSSEDEAFGNYILFEYGLTSFKQFENIIDDTKAAISDAERAYADASEEVNRLAGEYSEASKAASAFSDSIEEGSDSLEDAGTIIDRMQAKIREYYSIVNEFADEHTAILSSSLENMFSVVDRGAEYTMQQLTETLRKNAEAAAEWSSNLRTIYERGASADFVEWLESQGISYANAVKTIAESTQAEFDELVSQWQSNKATAASSGYAYGTALAQGIGSGIIDQIAALKRAARQAAQAVDNAFTNYMQIQSPSKLFRKYGRFTMIGYNEGLEDIPVQWPDIMTVPEVPDMSATAARLAAMTAGAGANYTYNYYVSDPSPEFYDRVMNGVNNTFGGVAYA